MRMIKLAFCGIIFAVCGVPASTAAQQTPMEEYFADEEYEPFYANFRAGMILPGNGLKANKPTATASVSAGWYANDTFAWEGTLSYAPNAPEALAGVAAGALWHWWGFERLDPFFTFGGAAMCGEAHIFSNGKHRTSIEPYAGAGTFWHITESISIRAEGTAHIDAASPCGMFYTISAGLQFSW
ncbi:MAG: hypothetical protein IJ802_05935 [Kiritimatiellae bacterium]|nr:hypothetical protein [Kiritimatiellia bacterium]